MLRKSLESLLMVSISLSLVIGAILASGCAGKEIESPTQITDNITPQEAFALIEENQDNPDFVIIDVRTPEEFAEEYIENAINLDYRSETFRDWLNILDKDKTYLIYCRSGRRSADALAMMEELNFKEAYNMLGGIIEWKAGGLPTIQQTPTQIIKDVTPQEAFTLIQENQGNPDFVIIDVRTPEEFTDGHIENAINLDYRSETFRDELDKLDKNKTYLIYYRCSCGHISERTLNIMAELNFTEAYSMSAGLEKWEKEGLPIVK